ncbi:MAG: SDR family NAD(P)-dependent oxidoreductase [Spirochaetales bacterium]|nr:SDR family NAD(P)-dependent oxidoreductase [Spirochaetales bacterium]
MKQIAIITGASGGLGKEFVHQILNDADEIWAIGRNLAKLELLKNEFIIENNLADNNSRIAQIIPVQMDLSDTKSLEVLSSKLKNESEKSEIEIHWLINNAGAGRFAPSTNFSIEELSGSITTHCTSIAAICNICIPFMKKGDYIINVSSQSAFCPLPYMNLYAATKSFVYSYSRSLGAELKKTGIIVTAVCPGWIKTALLPENLNGKKVYFPFIVTADKVAAKAIKDARHKKPLSIFSFAVRYVIWLQKHISTAFSLKIWCRLVEKYL